MGLHREQQQILLDPAVRKKLKIQAIQAKMTISAYIEKLVLEEGERQKCKKC